MTENIARLGKANSFCDVCSLPVKQHDKLKDVAWRKHSQWCKRVWQRICSDSTAVSQIEDQCTESQHFSQAILSVFLISLAFLKTPCAWIQETSFDYQLRLRQMSSSGAIVWANVCDRDRDLGNVVFTHIVALLQNMCRKLLISVNKLLSGFYFQSGARRVSKDKWNQNCTREQRDNKSEILGTGPQFYPGATQLIPEHTWPAQWYI